jgi:hypothetical protein
MKSESGDKPKLQLISEGDNSFNPPALRFGPHERSSAIEFKGVPSGRGSYMIDKSRGLIHVIPAIQPEEPEGPSTAS